MKEWTKKQKMSLIAAFAVIVAIAGIAAGILNNRETQEGIKTFKVEIISERDDYYEIGEFKSKEEYLGGFLRGYEGCEWQESEYGIYITGFKGMTEDFNDQFWWCVMVDGESAAAGADDIPLKDGSTYNFVLTQGW